MEQKHWNSLRDIFYSGFVNYMEVKLKLENSQVESLKKGGWRWGVSKEKRPGVILVDEECLSARRKGRAHNPIILAHDPLNEERDHFRVKVTQLGNFVGIGRERSFTSPFACKWINWRSE